jgi:hypothetical protein
MQVTTTGESPPGSLWVPGPGSHGHDSPAAEASQRRVSAGEMVVPRGFT